MDMLVEFILYQPWWAIYAVIFGFLLACGLGFPMPEDVLLFTMGYFAYNGLADLKVGILVCMAGVLIGDCTIYFLGHRFGSRLTKKAPFDKILPEQRLQRTKVLFHKWGNGLIFAARFMPGFRAPVFFSAGTLHLPFRVFFAYDFLASIISVPLLTYAMYRFGDRVDQVIHRAHQIQGGLAALIGGVIVLLIAKHFYLSRRELGSKNHL